MTRDEMLRRVAELHYQHSVKYADRVPYVKADENPHDGQTTDLSLWHVDRSAPPEVDDELNRAIARPDRRSEDMTMAKVTAAKATEPAPAVEDEATPVAEPARCPGADDGKCIGGPVNGAPCSYHAAYFRPDGSPR